MIFDAKRLLPMVLLLLGLSATAFAGELERAREMYRGEDVTGAISTVEAYLRDNPSDVTAYVDIGIYTRALGVKKQDRQLLRSALGYFKRADELERDPKGHVIIVGNIATTYVELREYARALHFYNEAFKLSGRVFYKILGAACLAESGNPKQAVKSVESLTLSTVLSADSHGNNGLAAYNMGIIYALANRAPEAVGWLRKALMQDRPRFASAMRRDTDLSRIRTTAEFRRLSEEAEHP